MRVRRRTVIWTIVITVGLAVASSFALFAFHIATSEGSESSASEPAPEGEKVPPAAWKRADLNEQMPYRWEAGPVHVLVWEVIDDGERVMERCLVLKQYNKPSDRGDTCALGYLRRFPTDEKPEWHAKTAWITPDREFKNPPAIWGCECYKSLPTDKEIASFLKERAWAGELEPYQALRGSTGKSKDYHPKLRDGGVCSDVWKAAFGRNAPAELFPELILTNKPEKK